MSNLAIKELNTTRRSRWHGLNHLQML